MCPQREGSTHFPLSIWPYAQLFQESVFVGMCCVLSCFSCVQLFATLWTIALQAPLSMGFPRQEYQSGLPFPPPGHLPDPGIKSTSPALPGKPFQMYKLCIKMDYNTHQTHHGYFICKGRKGPDQKVIARGAFHFTQNSLIFFTKKKNVCIFFRYLYMQKGWEIIY